MFSRGGIVVRCTLNSDLHQGGIDECSSRRHKGGFMKRLAISSALLLVFFAAVARAEKPISTSLNTNTVVSPGELKATPDMWFYDQAMRQYKDPQASVRAKADFRAQCRERRIESMKWFGMSNSRPRASSDPFHNDYSAGWVSCPGYFPSRWGGVTQP
jgi:hypothetical protein